MWSVPSSGCAKHCLCYLVHDSCHASAYTLSMLPEKIFNNRIHFFERGLHMTIPTYRVCHLPSYYICYRHIAAMLVQFKDIYRKNLNGWIIPQAACAECTCSTMIQFIIPISSACSHAHNTPCHKHTHTTLTHVESNNHFNNLHNHIAIYIYKCTHKVIRVLINKVLSNALLHTHTTHHSHTHTPHTHIPILVIVSTQLVLQDHMHINTHTNIHTRTHTHTQHSYSFCAG